MYHHFIFISISYAKATIVGYHLVVEGESIQEKMKWMYEIEGIHFP